MDNNSKIRDFLEIHYDELENLNLTAKKKAIDKEPIEEVKKYYCDYLEKEKRIKAVTLCFTDIEGRFHNLDYDKKHFLKSLDNLTFDGSSVRGFSEIGQSDLRLMPDWHSFRWAPSDVFGPGKVLMFGTITDLDGKPHPSDMRSRLMAHLEVLMKKDNMRCYTAPELEGFIVDGRYAEQNFDERIGFKLTSIGGYYHTLPVSTLKQFIDRAAEAQRAMGFENEKDHPEVAPSQFELNFSYTDAVISADQIQLYKLICRQVAHDMNMTATFLPKPIANIAGNGMHVNLSLYKGNKNAFFDKSGKYNLSSLCWDFISRIMNHSNEFCLVLNPSVNAYRRLDPKYEAPNQIRVSSTDRSAMVRIPIANERSTRIEIRSVAPDSNPYLLFYTLIRAGLEGEKLIEDSDKRHRLRVLPSVVNDAIRHFKSSELIGKILGEELKEKYIYLKQSAADRAPNSLGVTIKNGEILYHHEVTNQMLWNAF